MTFLYGFFHVCFLPVGIIALLGIVLFFWGKYRQEKWYYPLLFLIIVLAVISIWRIPVIFSRRYAMPTMVPGIVISVFALMLLPEILKKIKVPYAKAITRILITGLLIACVAKTMRPQEKKTYLHDISEAIKLDCQKNNIKKDVALLAFGDQGGYLELDDNVKVINIENKLFNNKFTDAEYQFSQLDKILNMEILRMTHPYIYLFCVENELDNFSRAWEKRYGEKPELVYKYIRTKDQANLCLYRIISEYKSAWIKPEEFERMLANKKSLFKNGDFKKKYRLAPEDKIAKILHDRGINLFANGDFYIPADWRINTDHGWTANCNPVSIKFATNALNVQSKDTISIYSNDTLDGNENYLIAIQANSETQGCLTVFAYTYKDKSSHAICLKEIKLSPQRARYLIPFTFRNCEKIRLALLFSGNVTINDINVFPKEELKK